MLIAMSLTGAGGSAGLASAVNSTAKSFPDSTRASATGAVLAGFGLSAFLFSTLGHSVYPGDAAGFLGLLSVGTGIPMLVGSWFIRPIPPRSDQGYQIVGQGEVDEEARDEVESMYEHASRGRRVDIPEIIITGESRASVDVYRVRSNSLELARSRDRSSNHNHRPMRFDLETAQGEEDEEDEYEREMALAKAATSDRNPASASQSEGHRSYHPLELLFHPPFLALAVVLGLLCGTGLMYINNVGLVVLALAREGEVNYDKEVIGGWQAQMVGLVSIWNCLGRILGGECLMSKIAFQI